MKRYERTDEELLQEVGMMANPMGWPLAMLPIKRQRENEAWPEFGVLLGDGPNVHLSTLYRLSESHEVRRYDNFQAIVDDGWVVD